MDEDISVGANIYFPNLHNSIIPHWTMKQHYCQQSKAEQHCTWGPSIVQIPYIWYSTRECALSVRLSFTTNISRLHPLCHYPCHDAYYSPPLLLLLLERTGNSISPPVTSGNEDLCRRIFAVHPYHRHPATTIHRTTKLISNSTFYATSAIHQSTQFHSFAIRKWIRLAQKY